MPIDYRVKEVGEVTDYTTTYSDDTFEITNTHTPEKTKVSGIKTWNLSFHTFVTVLFITFGV